MRIEVRKYPLGRKVYIKKFFSEQVIINAYCFACGFVIAMMIAVAM